MKKYLLAVVLFASTATALAQKTKNKAKLPNLIAYGGVTFPTIGGSESWEWGLVGGQIGVGVKFHSDGSKLGSQAALAYSMQGSKWAETGYKGKVLLNYLIVPLVVQYSLAKSFYVEGGIQPAFRLSAKDKYNGQTDDIKDHVESFDFSLPVGLAYVVANMVAINLRYTHGLTNIYKEGDDKHYNQVLALTVIVFAIKKNLKARNNNM